jgi:hypothetical protein
LKPPHYFYHNVFSCSVIAVVVSGIAVDVSGIAVDVSGIAWMFQA